MISLRNRVHLDASPDRVWECFREMDKRYHEWIPEHLRWRWLSGEPLATGSTWHADEWVGPMRIDSRLADLGLPGIPRAHAREFSLQRRQRWWM